MGRATQKFLVQLAISAMAAVAAPVVAAGLVTGMSAAASAGSEAVGPLYPYATPARPDIDSNPSPYIDAPVPARPGSLDR